MPQRSTQLRDADGSDLLTGPEVEDLLRAAVAHGGGTLVDWELDHVDANPNQSTTATYSATVDWPFGRRTELLGISARAGGRSRKDERAVIFADGEREVAVWLYPRDPELPGLVRAAFPGEMAAVFNEYRVFPEPVTEAQVRLEMIGYRPRRRAVLKATVATSRGPVNLFIKVLRTSAMPEVLQRHQLLLGAGVPAPIVAAATEDCILVLRELPGRPLAQAIFDPVAPCTAEQLIGVLDAMPPQVALLNRRPPWTDAVAHYTEMVVDVLPAVERQLRWLTTTIVDGVRGVPPGNEPTHGDFHEGQLFVSTGPGGAMISGILDVDTAGPGNRADDLACLVAHLSTVQRMNTDQSARVQDLLSTWVPVFDQRVDPVQLRLRAAAVIISLATGPYRGQEPSWEKETRGIVDAAEILVRQVA